MRITDIQTMPDVMQYWHECLDDAENAENDMVLAGWIGGVIHPDVYDKFSEGKNDGHPAFEIITELALDLETPNDKGKWRQEKWDCIHSLLALLDKKYTSGYSSETPQ